MFILLKSGAMLNLYWLQDCFQGKVDNNIVIFYMVNGSKVIEKYETEAEAKARVDEVHELMANAGTGGGGSGAVSSVNGLTGNVVLNAENINTSDGIALQTIITDCLEWKEY